MARSVTFDFDQSVHNTFRVELEIAAHGRGIDTETHIATALVYLSTWAMDSDRYAHCHIQLMPTQHEMVACYYDKPRGPGADGQYPRPTYAIGAVWHSDHFGFHS